MTWACWLTAQRMPLASATGSITPPAPTMRTSSRSAPHGSTPAIPCPLLACAAMMPATAVPWSMAHCGAPWAKLRMFLITDVPSGRWNSGLRGSIPPSTTATVTLRGKAGGEGQ